MQEMSLARVLLSSAFVFAVACAADPGDAPKSESAAMTPPPGGGSSSGASADTDASTVVEPPPSDAAGGTVEAAAPVDATTPPIEASPPPPSCTTCPLTVEYYTRNPVPTAMNTVRFDVSITNNGTMPQALSDLTLRYWFTADGASSFAWNEYYAVSPINGNVKGAFTKLTSSTTPAATATADTYFEVSFNAAAGSIAPGTSTNDIQLAFNDSTYATNFNETNDYSYVGTDSMASCGGANNVLTCQSPTITLYRAGSLAFGTEPGGSTAPAGDP